MFITTVIGCTRKCLNITISYKRLVTDWFEFVLEQSQLVAFYVNSTPQTVIKSLEPGAMWLDGWETAGGATVILIIIVRQRAAGRTYLRNSDFLLQYDSNH